MRTRSAVLRRRVRRRRTRQPPARHRERRARASRRGRGARRIKSRRGCATPTCRSSTATARGRRRWRSVTRPPARCVEAGSACVTCARRPRRHGVRARLRAVRAVRRGPSRAVRARRRRQHGGTLLSGARRHHHADGARAQPPPRLLGFRRARGRVRRSLVKVDDDLPLDQAALFGCAVLTGVGAVVNTAQVRRASRSPWSASAGWGSARCSARSPRARARWSPSTRCRTSSSSRERSARRTPCTPDRTLPTRSATSTSGGVDVAVEMAGSVHAFETAYRITRRGGTTVTGGLPQPGRDVDAFAGAPGRRGAHHQGQLHRLGVPSRDIPRYIELFRAGHLPVDRLLGDARRARRHQRRARPPRLGARAASGRDDECLKHDTRGDFVPGCTSPRAGWTTTSTPVISITSFTTRTSTRSSTDAG